MTNHYNLLIVDDDKDTLRILERYLKTEAYSVYLAESGEEALKILAKTPVHLVFSDLIMPQMDGMTLISHIKEINPSIPVIIVTAFASIDSAVKAMRAGAFDYVTKPVIREELLVKADKALEQFRIHEEITELKEIVQRELYAKEIIGDSPAIKKVLDLAYLVAKRDIPVVLTGESGTGKEILAKAIHSASIRSKKPVVAINCGALPETLLESELFGYEKGAFTDASSTHKGLFEAADGGTLFLDEIGDASSMIQLKLLRALQEQAIRRVGGNTDIPVNVRIIAATNRNLEEEVQKKSFRDDLYYRLNVISIHLPPLRERKEDIPQFADYFIKLYGPPLNPGVKGIAKEATYRLLSYSWPGNVRELANVIRRALVMTRSETIMPGDLLFQGPVPEQITGGIADSSLDKEGNLMNMKGAVTSFETTYLKNILSEVNGNVSMAADIAGLSRKVMYDYIKRLNIDIKSFKKKNIGG